MLDSFIKGIEKEQPNFEVEKIYLTDIEFEYFSFENRLGPTENEKEFSSLCESITQADALVIAAPTYNFSVPAQLKNFIDRIRFFALDFNDQTKLRQPRGKLPYLQTYFLVSGGTPRWAQRMLFFAFPPFWLRNVFLYYGAECMGAYYTGDVGAFQNDKVMNMCKKKGACFAKNLAKEKRQNIPERIFWRPPQYD